MRLLARILVSIWGVGWAFFNIASGVGEGLQGWGFAFLFFHLVEGLLFLAVVYVTWYSRLIAKVTLVVAGLFLLLIFTPALFSGNLDILVLSLLALPPLGAAILFWIDDRKDSRNAREKPPQGEGDSPWHSHLR